MSSCVEESIDELKEVRDFLKQCYEADFDAYSFLPGLSPEKKEIFLFYVNLANSTNRDVGKLVSAVNSGISTYSDRLTVYLENLQKATNYYQKIMAFYDVAFSTEEFVESFWTLLPYSTRKRFKKSALKFIEFPMGKCTSGLSWSDIAIFFESVKHRKNLFELWVFGIQAYSGSILSASNRDRDPNAGDLRVADYHLRGIAYSIDTLEPGFYVWFRGFRFRIGGSFPPDKPYYYPGVIHSRSGVAVVLPGYHLFSTYRGSHDPQFT